MWQERNKAFKKWESAAKKDSLSGKRELPIRMSRCFRSTGGGVLRTTVNHATIQKPKLPRKAFTRAQRGAYDYPQLRYAIRVDGLVP